MRASLGTFTDGSQAKVGPISEQQWRPNLPCFRLVGILFVLVVGIVVFVVEEVIIVVGFWIVRVVVLRSPRHDVGSAEAFGFSRFGGGYVDQKCRPHRGHTQNWSGVQGMPGPGSRISMSAPQR